MTQPRNGKEEGTHRVPSFFLNRTSEARSLERMVHREWKAVPAAGGSESVFHVPFLKGEGFDAPGGGHEFPDEP